MIKVSAGGPDMTSKTRRSFSTETQTWTGTTMTPPRLPTVAAVLGQGVTIPEEVASKLRQDEPADVLPVEAARVARIDQLSAAARTASQARQTVRRRPADPNTGPITGGTNPINRPGPSLR